MENKKLTSVIDVPREAGQADLFGIDKYKDAQNIRRGKKL